MSERITSVKTDEQGKGHQAVNIHHSDKETAPFSSALLEAASAVDNGARFAYVIVDDLDTHPTKRIEYVIQRREYEHVSGQRVRPVTPGQEGYDTAHDLVDDRG